MSIWLTRITLNRRDKQVQRDLRDVVHLHRTVMSLFPADLGVNARNSAGILFRTETTGDGTSLLIQSRIEPDPQLLPADYGVCHSRSLDPLLTALRPGLPVRYRIIANATRKLGRNTQAGKPGQIIPLNGAEAEQWWLRHAELAGLQLRTNSATGLTAAHGLRTDRTTDTRQPQRHSRTQFDGTATITDPELLRDGIQTGIGRGKSYGCGLLTLAPAR